MELLSFDAMKTSRKKQQISIWQFLQRPYFPSTNSLTFQDSFSRAGKGNSKGSKRIHQRITYMFSIIKQYQKESINRSRYIYKSVELSFRVCDLTDLYTGKQHILHRPLIACLRTVFTYKSPTVSQERHITVLKVLRINIPYDCSL